MKNILILCLLMSAFSISVNAQKNSKKKSRNEEILKVMSYNMRIASPPSTNWKGTDLAAIANVIKLNKPALVALQEVDAYTERSGKDSYQAQELAKMTGMYFTFAKAVDRSGGDYGVAVLSRFPIISSEAHRLPVGQNSQGEIRGLAFITVKAFKNRIIGFMSTHLDHLSNEDRRLQVEKVIEVSERYKDIPIILGADLNMEPDNEVMDLVKKEFIMSCDNCPLTFPQINTKVTIDYILMNQAASKVLKVEKYWTAEEKYASDHLPLLAEFKLIK